MDAIDWGDVFELVEKNKTSTLKNLFEDGMTFEEFQNTYWGRLEDNEYLHRAAEQGTLPMVKLLIEQGADPDELDDVYQTPLERAFLAKKKQVAKYLFERTQSETAKQLVKDTLYPSRKKGRNLPQIDPELKQAIEEKSLKTVRALIKNGVPVNAKFKTEYKCDSTPLKLAVDLNALKIAEALLIAGANPNPVPTEDHPLATALFRQSAKMMSLLLEHGANPNHPGDLKKTCLMDAVDREEIQFVNLLLDAGTDLNLRDAEGRQAIHFGSFLKSHRYDPQKEKKKLLHSANITIRLIEAGTDLQAEPESGSTKLMGLYSEPRWGDTHQRYLDFKAALIEAGVLDTRIDDLLGLVRQNKITEVRKLIKEGVNVNHRGDLLPFAGQVTPLAMAVICGHHILAELLLKSGANSDTQSKSFRFGVEDPNAEEPRPYNVMEEDPHYFGHGLSWVRPLGIAVWKNDPEMIQILADANASLMLSAGDGGSPLVWAIDLAHLESVQALLSAGANPHKSRSSSADAVFYANLDHTHPNIKKLVNRAAKKFK